MVIRLLDARLRVVNDVPVTSIFQPTIDFTDACVSGGTNSFGRGVTS